MKINDRYEIRVVVLEIRDDIGVHNSIGDIYDNFEEFKKDKPYSSYKFGYVVFDTEYGYVPDECNDWNDSPEEAMFDYEYNCCQTEEIIMKHFVVVNDWSNEYEGGTTILGVTHSIEEAKEIFNKYLVDEKQYAEENGFEIYDDCETVFDAGKDGYYRIEHTNLYIQMI